MFLPLVPVAGRLTPAVLTVAGLVVLGCVGFCVRLCGWRGYVEPPRAGKKGGLSNARTRKLELQDGEADSQF